MKKSLLLLFVLNSVCCYAQQVKIDLTVISRYDQEVRKMKPEYKTVDYQSNMKAIESEGKMGFMFFTVYDVDTLNKNEYLANKNFRYPRKDTTLNFSKELAYSYLFSMGYFDKDTLKINLPLLPMFSAPLIYQKIYHSKISATWEYLGYTPLFKSNLKQVSSGQLSVPTKISNYVLSTANYSIGQTVYGEGEVLTDPFYIDNSGFKNGYIKLQYHCKYFFKFKILENPFAHQ